MIHPYEWPEYRLLVTVTNRVQATPFLVDRVEQAEFLTYWASLWDSVRDKRITRMEVQPLTQESYDLLEPLYEGKYIVE